MRKERQVIERDGVVTIKVRGQKSASKNKVPLDWDSDEVGDGKSAGVERKGGWLFYAILGCVGGSVLGIMVWGAVMMMGSSAKKGGSAVVQLNEGAIKKQMLDARQVAVAFLAESDADQRLQYVRNPEVVKSHWDRYEDEVLTFPAEIVKDVGARVSDSGGESAYWVEFSSGNVRLLSVVATEHGAKVDWDSYARYCSVSWERLFSGDAQGADVRVFVRPGDYHVGYFRDPKKWTCFLIEVPDSDRRIYVYAAAGSTLSKRMQSEVMKNRNFRQHMSLRISSIEVDGGRSGKDALFVVDELLAVGWVVKG